MENPAARVDLDQLKASLKATKKTLYEYQIPYARDKTVAIKNNFT